MHELTCRGCGQIAHRIRTTFTANGKTMPEPKDECEHCAEMGGKITLPTDQRLWLTADAQPNEYETRGETRVMKDWAQGELQQRIARADPDEEEMVRASKDRKRKHAQATRAVYGTQLTPEQIRSLTEQSNAVRARQLADSSGLIVL